MPVYVYIVLGLLILMAWLAQNRTYILQYLFFCRFPLFFGFLLVFLLPLAVSTWATDFLGNLIVLQGWEVFIVSLLAVLLALAVRNTMMRTLELIPHRNTLGFVRREVPPTAPPGSKDLVRRVYIRMVAASAWLYRWLYALAGGPSRKYTRAEQQRYEWLSLILYAMLAVPLLILMAKQGRGTDTLFLLAGSGLGLALGALTILYEPAQKNDRWQALRKWRREKKQHWSLSVLRHPFWTIGGAVVGFMIDPCCLGTRRKGRGRPPEALPVSELIRRNGRAAFLTTTVVFVFGLLFFFSAPQAGVPWVPALAMVLVLIILCCFILGLLAVFLDVFRVPVLLTVLFILVGVYPANNVDYSYRWHIDKRISADNTTVPSVLTPTAVFRQWQAAHPGDSVLTVVTASGGGIRASRWAAEVLSRLNEATEGRFAHSTLFISSVSGGSVGSMYFLERLPANEVVDLAAIGDTVRDAAGQSSLYATVHGFVYGDFWRWLFPLIESDRGRSLETVWGLRLKDSEASLNLWYTPPDSAWRPYPVFNTTIAETGEPFFISPVGFIGDSTRSFANIYSGRDLHLSTAARLSATFPIVSPIARPASTASDADDAVPQALRVIDDKIAYHLADGGYFDNHGVMTARMFLEEVLKADTSHTVRKVLFVQIRSAEAERKTAETSSGLKFATIGPLSTLAAVRSASQVTRNNEELRLFRAMIHQQVARNLEIVDSLVFSVDGVNTLSWHLSEAEKDSISSKWNTGHNLAMCQAMLQHLSLPGSLDSTASRLRCHASLR